jgi:hypothetical protein
MISDLLSVEGAELIVGKLAETFKSKLTCYWMPKTKINT